MDQLSALGYRPEEQARELCLPERPCQQAVNLVAVRPGRDPSSSVLVCAHYDTVPGSPGAADNGAGVAVLLSLAAEVATRPPTRNSVVFLFSDAEEVGLVGADVFQRFHPWAPRVRAVVNLDARGTRGPSLMFETGSGNAALVRLWARSVSRPVTSSVFSRLYRLTPHDTDFSIFVRSRLHGFNLALLAGGEHYHRASDTLANLSPASLLHHTKTAQEVVLALAEAEVPLDRSRDATYFDFLSLTTVHWPIAWNLPAALLLLAWCVTLLEALRRRRRLVPSSWWRILLRFASAVFLLVLLAGLLAVTTGLNGEQEPEPHLLASAPWIAASWLTAMLVAVGAVALWLRPTSFLASWAAVWLFWSALTAGLSLGLPEACSLTLIPGLLALSLGTAASGLQSPLLLWASGVLPLVSAVCLWFPLLLFTPMALGATGLLGAAVGVAFLGLSASPLAAGSIPWPGPVSVDG